MTLPDSHHLRIPVPRATKTAGAFGPMGSAAAGAARGAKNMFFGPGGGRAFREAAPGVARTMGKTMQGLHTHVNPRTLSTIGAAAGAAKGMVDPGTDEEGNDKSRIWSGLKGAVGGGAIGGIAGNIGQNVVNTAVKNKFDQMGGAKEFNRAKARAQGKAASKFPRLPRI